MNTSAKVYIAGHQGLVGSAIVRSLRAREFSNLVLRTRQELDLTDGEAVKRFFIEERPEYVFLAAARVGGILANSRSPADFIRENLLIQTHVIHYAFVAGVRRLMFLGSSCVYPKHAPQPLKEEYLLTGPLEVSNRAYALAKIAGIEMCGAYNRQHGTEYMAAMPTNLFGPGDNYDLHDAHVIPALLRKMHEAKASEAREVEIWGSGTPQREFLYSDDAAEACIFLLSSSRGSLRELWANEECFPVVNIGHGKDITIGELARLIAEIVGYKGVVVFDTSKPDGTPRKLLDISRLTGLGWAPRFQLRESLEKLYCDFSTSGYPWTEQALSSL